MVSISRDPFARLTLVRECEDGPEGCAWCGQTRKGKRLFRYGWEQDSGQIHWHRRRFCSVGCMRDYDDR